jgi:ribosome-binding protein aMBF1 (putative translation factor)
MWFIREKLAQAINANGFKREWLHKRLGISAAAFYQIASGERAANYRVAKELLQVLGYDATVAAIDWGRTRYAG